MNVELLAVYLCVTCVNYYGPMILVFIILLLCCMYMHVYCCGIYIYVYNIAYTRSVLHRKPVLGSDRMKCVQGHVAPVNLV